MDLTPTGPLVPRRWPRLYLLAEGLVLFVVLPLTLYLVRYELGGWLIPGLVVGGAACLGVLWADPAFDRRRLWNARDLGVGLRRILWLFLPGAAVLTLAVVLFLPELWLAFPHSQPGLWVMVMVLYPLLSVFPQEIIFRTYFCHRYRALLPRASWRIVASGLSFGLAHVAFDNWIAPLLTALGGMLFARTYERSGSTLQASLEHALWGDFLFTVGLGWYFYTGSIQ